MWRRVVALMIKEFLALLKDKKGRMVFIGPPIIQLIVFGYAATFDLNQVPYAVFNEDSGAAARQFLQRVEGSPAFSLTGYLPDRSPYRHQKSAPRAPYRSPLHGGTPASSNGTASGHH
jgi:ABC-2 type transport system permease protein